MKKLLIVALLAVSATCQNQSTVLAEQPIVEINARVVGDQLPVDGCGAHLWLNFTSPSSDSRTFQRLPTDATRSLMDNIIKAEAASQPTGTLWMGSKDVLIRYRETGQTATLLCGWNAKQELKTIELLDIKAR
ncbi:hypothetical protein [Fibrella forsythiae]|uniref:Lipoprotein n=1 Tax=Fibrella forsythiae TaxID=2817061 RepID=A0ABS3JNL2_9BACT|nr:hypothetical protein [Fibrella forsythiae]MBO0951591.1 hypothetical protein [Fibrella forsythiae]